MLINQILFQQKLGQENNCTIFLTKTTDINGLWCSQRAGGRKKEDAERLSGREHVHRKRRDWNNFKVVSPVGPSSPEVQLFAHPPPKNRLSVLGTMGFIRGLFAHGQWQPLGG